MPETIQTRLLHLTSKNEIGRQPVASPSEGYSDVCVSSWASRRLTNRPSEGGVKDVRCQWSDLVGSAD